MSYELDNLKERAKALGIGFSNNISEAKLAERIQAIVGDSTSREEDINAENKLRLHLQNEGKKLIRVSLQNMNPAKKDVNMELVCVTNSYLGTVKRYIPLQSSSTHIEKCLLDSIKEMEYFHINLETSGKFKKTERFYKEWSITELPPLTKEEIEELAKTQQATRSLVDTD